MVEGIANTAEWNKFGLRQLLQPITEAKDEKKYLFIWDKTGNVPTFMHYKGQLACLAPECVKVSLGRQTMQDVGEYFRAQVVNGMRSGENLCFDMDKTKPDWDAMAQEGTFDPNVFFSYERFN